MIKTLIVDDEPNIREGLKLIIDWNALGYEIIAEASNGREALLLIEKFKPRLVITDIKMPEVSGLDLIRECKNRGDTCSFIILSGHSEFSMAKEALHLGACDYLLKPVDEDELELALIKLKTDEINDQNIIPKKLYIKSLLQGILNGNKKSDISNIKKELGLTNERSFYYALIDFHQIKINIEKVEDIIQDIIGPDVTTSVLHEKDSYFGLFIHSGLTREYRNSVSRFSMFLISSILNRYDYDVSIYIGSKRQDLLELNISRLDAIKTSEHRYYKEIGTIIEYKDIQDIDFNYEYSDLELVDKIAKGIIKNDKITEELIKELITTFKSSYLSADIIYIHLNKLLNTIIKTVTDLNGDIDSIISAASFIINREEQIYLNNLETKLLEFKIVAINSIQILNSKGNSAKELKNYIDENYKENLTLGYVADIMGLNSAYLGQIFKKEIGESFNTYLHKLRLTEAKELLTSTDIKIYEVANRVGYQDVNYFMKKFENTFNTTPKQYRKAIK
ncbi:MAG: response regulator [Spirochaetaceae bacterium]